MRQCVWCQGRQGPLEPLVVPTTGPGLGRGAPAQRAVHPEHRAQAEAYFAAVARHGRGFVVLLLTLAFLPLAALPLEGVGLLGDGGVELLCGVGLVGIGVACWFRPFCTPQTIAMFGVRSSIRLARVLGVLTAALGVAIPLLSAAAA